MVVIISHDDLIEQSEVEKRRAWVEEDRSRGTYNVTNSRAISFAYIISAVCEHDVLRLPTTLLGRRRMNGVADGAE